MSRQRVFLEQPKPTTETKLTPSGNDFRVSDIIVTTADVEYEFRGYAENGDAVWTFKPNADTLDAKAAKVHYTSKSILACEFLDGDVPPDAYTRLQTASGSKGAAIIRNFGGAAGDTNQDVKVNFRLPADYVPGTPFKFSIAGFVSNSTKIASGEKLAFGLAGYCVADNIGLDSTMGTEIIVSKTAAADYVQYKRFATELSGDVTATNAVPSGYLRLNMRRICTDANDTYAKPFGISSIELQYQVNVVAVN